LTSKTRAANVTETAYYDAAVRKPSKTFDWKRQRART
jgi:hypothetical protein